MKHSSISEPGADEVKRAVDALGQAFEEFKSTNDMRLNGQRDILVEEKVDRISRELDSMQSTVDKLFMAARRPGLVGTDGPASPDGEYKAAFYDRFVRRGDENALLTLERKALSAGSDADGGFAVPEQLDQTIEKLLQNVSPIRRLANVVQIGSSGYRKLVNIGGSMSGWAAETATRPETDTAEFAEVVPPLGELYANPAATQAMLDDAFFNVEAWLAEELTTEFSVQEGAAFVNGNGTDKPKGFLTSPVATSDDASRAFGTLQYVATGTDGAFPASNPADTLVDLIYRLKPAYRAGATFVMNTNLIAEIRKFKDADGTYLWKPGLAENQPPSLLGYEIAEAADMPDIASDSFSIAFGNFARGYVITDRTGAHILRDPFTNKPFVHFYTTKRVGGAVVNSDAIKLLKFGTS